jgi:hypothetical protein
LELTAEEEAEEKKGRMSILRNVSTYSARELKRKKL